MRTQTCRVQGLRQLSKVMKQGFAAGDDNNLCRCCLDGVDQGLNGINGVLTGLPAFFYIAPHAAHIAAAQANEVSRSSLVYAFTLERVKMLHHRELAARMLFSYRTILYCSLFGHDHVVKLFSCRRDITHRNA